VQFVINYEDGGENNILHGDAASEAFLSEIVGAAPWPGMRHMNLESICEYGSRAGFWRLRRMFTDRSVPVTVYAVATAMARNVEAVAAMNEAGWEIAAHGLKWIDVEVRHHIQWRLDNDSETETRMALAEIDRIAALRLKES
jgi:chitin deacetylase